MDGLVDEKAQFHIEYIKHRSSCVRGCELSRDQEEAKQDRFPREKKSKANPDGSPTGGG